MLRNVVKLFVPRDPGVWRVSLRLLGQVFAAHVQIPKLCFELATFSLLWILHYA